MTETEEVTEEQAVTTNEGTPTSKETIASPEQAEVEQGKAEAAEEAPKTWDGFELSAVEGHDKESLAAFGEAAKEQGIAPDSAQKMLDQIVPILQERQMASLDAIHKDWIESSKSDALIGGDKFDENMAIAKKCAEAFGDDDLQTLLKPVSEGGQGLGNHPAVNRFFFRAGMKMLPDAEIVKGTPPPGGEEDEGAILYPEMTRQMKESR